MPIKSVDNIVTDNLDQVIDAPDGIKRLRELILQLAVQGKLVEQRPEEGTADELLEQIQEAKRKDAEERKARGDRIPKQKPLPPIDNSEKLFQIPPHWEWVRMHNLCTWITSGSTPPKSNFSAEKGVPFLKVYNIRNQKIDFEYKSQFVDEEYHLTKLKRSRLLSGDVVMNIVGPPLGKVAIIPDDYPEYNCNQAIVFFRPIEKSTNQYLYVFLKAGVFLENIALIGTAGQDNISVTKSRTIPIPLPPLAEQKRIVAKVDELMVWCDELETLKQKRDALQKASLKATLRDLLGTPKPSEGGTAGESFQALENLSALVRDPTDVKQLRDAILQLAVQGRLVPQREEDGTADDLLKQIEAAKTADLHRRKTAGERIRKTKPLPSIGKDEIPFDIPNDWKWVRLGDVARYGESKKVSPNDIADDTWVLELEDIEKNTSRILNRHTFGQRKSKSSKATFKHGDVLYGKLRPYLNKAVVADSDGVCTTEIVAIEQYEGIESFFMLNVLKSPYFIGHVNDLTYGIKMPRLGTTDARNTAIPLPPLAEQQRIVRKVDELMAWCDELETLLQTQSNTATRFAAAIAQQGGKNETSPPLD